ncbi:MAG TPA: PhoX family phosphatase [Nevskiaceae bacterium]|nr:PhoX family phosphatase [Nevskiaceae bacterium]
MSNPEQSLSFTVDHDDDVCTNPSTTPHFAEILEQRVSRRGVLKGGMGAAAATFVGGSLLAAPEARAQTSLTLGFNAVGKTLADQVTVPEGYSVSVLTAKGDPLADAVSDYLNDGSQTDFEMRVGDEHDALYYFGMDANGGFDPSNSNRGLLVMNHEVTRPEQLFSDGARVRPDGARPAFQVRAEMQAHGVSVIEIAKDGNGRFQVVRNSPFNRRVHGYTPMNIRGPMRGNALAVTAYSTRGLRTRGTLNNCANGYTPWGTYLTCEENWAGYFTRTPGSESLFSAKELQSHTRYGVGSSGNSRYQWERGPASYMKRHNITPTGASAAEDFRNEAFLQGWVVEIDPFSPASLPQKRTALGRFAHEGAWVGPVVAGQPIVYYMGCDSRNEYVYKFVSARNWDPADVGGGVAAGHKYLDRGTLYAAKFKADGSGEWVELSFGVNGLDASNSLYPFADQADVVCNARLAADSVGATPMDRPEWAAVNPLNGEVYLTLTNNSNRRVMPSSSSHRPVDAANPRDFNDPEATSNPNLPGGGNRNGHIIRWAEAGNDPTALAFQWDIYLFGAQANADAARVNLSGLTAENDFSSPDGLWFGRESHAGAGLLWIQTDDGAYTDTTNCMMLAAIPGQVGDGGTVAVNGVTTFRGAVATPSTVRRFLVGPLGCEITGVDTTPDGRTMFVNIQHPGEDGAPGSQQSGWPSNQFAGLPGDRPRSATVVITKNDGGIIGL